MFRINIERILGLLVIYLSLASILSSCKLNDHARIFFCSPDNRLLNSVFIDTIDQNFVSNDVYGKIDLTCSTKKVFCLKGGNINFAFERTGLGMGKKITNVDGTFFIQWQPDYAKKQLIMRTLYKNGKLYSEIRSCRNNDIMFK